MSSPEDLEKYLNDAELATAHLPELFEGLIETDSEAANYAVEAFENCGPPLVESIQLLCERSQDKNSLVSYWACTLLGRAIQEGLVTIDKSNSLSQASAHSEKSTGDTVLKSLCNVIGDVQYDSSTRERAMVALSNSGELNAATRAFLETQLSDATPRMKRLIAAALQKAN